MTVTLIRNRQSKDCECVYLQSLFLGSMVVGWALITPAGGTLPLSGAQFQGDKGNAHYAIIHARA